MYMYVCMYVCMCMYVRMSFLNSPTALFLNPSVKVHTLITCLYPAPPSNFLSSSSPPSPSRSPSPSTSPLFHSMYESAYSPEIFAQAGSIYHSLTEGHSNDINISPTHSVIPSLKHQSNAFVGQISDKKARKERFHRRLLMATEKLVSANLSIDEVLLSLSSRGELY